MARVAGAPTAAADRCRCCARARTVAGTTATRSDAKCAVSRGSEGAECRVKGRCVQDQIESSTGPESVDYRFKVENNI